MGDQIEINIKDVNLTILNPTLSNKHIKKFLGGFGIGEFEHKDKDINTIIIIHHHEDVWKTASILTGTEGLKYLKVLIEDRLSVIEANIEAGVNTKTEIG